MPSAVAQAGGKKIKNDFILKETLKAIKSTNCETAGLSPTSTGPATCFDAKGAKTGKKATKPPIQTRESYAGLKILPPGAYEKVQVYSAEKA